MTTEAGSCDYCGGNQVAIVARDGEGRTICAECDRDEIPAYMRGFHTALFEIEDGTASHHGAELRGMFVGDPDAQMAWDDGYARAVMLFRLGFDLEVLKEFGDAVLEDGTTGLVERLLDGAWPLQIRVDPRRQQEHPVVTAPHQEVSCSPSQPAPDRADNEQFYNEHIAPLMAQVLDKCKERRLPFVCPMEISDDLSVPDEVGRRGFAITALLPKGTSARIMTAYKLISTGTASFAASVPQTRELPVIRPTIMGPLGPVRAGSA
ncbi:hypothetical protein EKK58_05470 [Candidatus Dependentiae bacterium]|nr:MAG: hypothetical protein EKK58_05470 [Candidatus Dependentiae bacterium]